MIDVSPLVRHRRVVLVAWLTVVVLALPGLRHLGLDSSAEIFYVDDPAAIERERDFRGHFGSDRGVRVIVEGEALWTREGLAWLATLEHEASRLPGVTAAGGLARHHAWRFSDWPPENPAALRRQVRDDPFDRGVGFVDPAGEVATVWVGLAGLPIERRHATLDALDALLGTAPVGLTTRRVGLPIVARALDRSLLGSLRLLLPLVGLVSAALLFLVLGRWSDVFAPLLLVVSVEATVFGLLGHLGATLDVVSSVLAPVLYVVVLAMAVHVQVALRRARTHREPTDAIVTTWRRKAAPVLWTGATTAVGFGSLGTSALAPVRDLGTWAAFGLLLGSAAVLFVQPAWVATVGAPGRPAATRFELGTRRLGRALATRAVDHRRLVSAILVGLALVSLLGIGRLRAENDVLGFFRAGHPVRVDLDALADHGLGVVAVELVLRPTAGTTFDGPEARDQLASLADALRADPDVVGVVGVADLVVGVERARSGDPATLIASLAALDALHRRFVSRDGERARLTVSLPWLDQRRPTAILDRLDATARRLVAETWPDVEVGWTGQFYRVLEAQEHLMATLVRSTAVTFGVVGVLFLVVLGPGLAVRAMVPNVLPGLVTLGALGWADVAIDATLVLHVSIVLGLAVDDTLHTLSRVVAADRRATPERAVIEALETTAPAHVATSLLLALGFGVWAVSDMVPVARFGLVSAASILVVLAADLVVVPALLARVPASARERARRFGF